MMLEFPQAELAEEQTTPADRTIEALTALATVLSFHEVIVDVPRLLREASADPVDRAGDLVRLGRKFGLKARQIACGWEDLENISLPAIACLGDGGFLFIAKAHEDRILIQRSIHGIAKIGVIGKDEFLSRWNGNLILYTKRANLSGAARAFDLLWFLGSIVKYKKIIIEVLTASAFLQILSLISPLFFQVVVDKVLVHRAIGTLDLIVIGLIAIAIFETALGGMRNYVFSHTTNRVDVELGARTFRHLLSLPISYFHTRRVGVTVARIRELENIRQFITGSAITGVIDFVFTIIFLIVMSFYSTPLTIMVAASIPIYVMISIAVGPQFQTRLQEKFQRGAESQSLLVESVSGMETVKSMAVEPQTIRRWEEQLASYVMASFRVSNLSNWATQFVQLISKIVTALIIYFGAKSVLQGQMTVGELVAFNMLAQRVSTPVLRLAQMWQDFHQVRLSIARLGDILNAPSEPGTSVVQATLPKIRGAIRFERVYFRYKPDGPEVLSDVTVNIAEGQVVGIVGSSGSGKSTVAKIVQRLYSPETGRVLIDGVDLSLVDPAWLRSQVGVVLQESVLFNRSIRDNIALSDPGASSERVIEAAHLAGAHEFISEMPYGYDTILEERGGNLSGGQRQRIAIARALLSDPKILIFDEATSALDYESEQIIQHNMRKICAGRTVLIIAHRLSAVRIADRILTLERGRVVEDGTHEELSSRGGRYASLLHIQVGVMNEFA